MLLFGVLPLFGQNWVQKCTKNGQKGGSIFFLAPSARKFSKRCLYLGVAFIYPKKKIEVYALIRSVASIRVLLLFGGGGTPFLALFVHFGDFR